MTILTTVAGCVLGVPAMVYTYKCAMMVLFQNKLIYLPYLPPGSKDPKNWEQSIKPYTLGNHPKRWKITPKAIFYQPTLAWPLKKLKSFRKGTLRGFILENSPKSPKITANPQFGKHVYRLGSSKFGDFDHSPSLSKIPELGLIYFQGNGGNMYHRIELFEGLLKTADSLGIKLSVVAIHLRGYGDSSGPGPSQQGCMEDALEIFKATQEWLPKARLILYGHSLGGAVATHLLKHSPPISGLVLENTFTSILSMVESLYPKWLPYRYLARVFLRSPWDSLTMLSKYSHKVPSLMLLSCVGDDVVPHDMMVQLKQVASTANPDLRWVTFTHGHHANAHHQPNFWNSWSNFLKDQANSSAP